MIIAVDGPAAAGKGTLARRLAAHFGLAYLDTGSLYRAVGLAVLRAGEDPTDAVAAEKAARTLDFDMVNDPEIRAEGVGEAASAVAAIPAVRAALLAFQRAVAVHPPDGANGAVLDGRDIGTVVCPDADHKLFLTASLETRANRRFNELRQRDQKVIRSRVLRDMERRDRQDESRGISPLKPAGDALELDTSDLDADAVFAKALDYIASRNSPAD